MLPFSFLMVKNGTNDSFFLFFLFSDQKTNKQPKKNNLCIFILTNICYISFSSNKIFFFFNYYKKQKLTFLCLISSSSSCSFFILSRRRILLFYFKIICLDTERFIDFLSLSLLDNIEKKNKKINIF